MGGRLRLRLFAPTFILPRGGGGNKKSPLVMLLGLRELRLCALKLKKYTLQLLSV